MSLRQEEKIHEQSFCADVKCWAEMIFQAHPDWNFSHASVEEHVGGSRRRHDLRFYVKGCQTPVLCGEVKLPGTPEGRSPFDPLLMQDAYLKADQIQTDYFFTWNVNRFVLFDRSRWNRPMIERRIRDWDLGLNLIRPSDCLRPDVRAHVKDKFLPEFLEFFNSIVSGKIIEWGKAADDIFIGSLESHLDWPVIGTKQFLIERSLSDRPFSARLDSWMANEMEWTFDPERPESRHMAVENAARTLCYVFCNRAIFYEALRARYGDVLSALELPRPGKSGHEGIYRHFKSRFQHAMEESGDYEPIFYPQVEDEWGALVFASETACNGWRGVFTILAEYNFKKIPHDVIGGIFQKLISPEERQKFGQFFTGEDIVDLINAFCIRKAGDQVMDPACGSGSFLIRAYHRKAWLSQHEHGGRRHQDRSKSHQEILREIYGTDVAIFAAHLATLNLAAREIGDKDNYPQIARRNFFEIPGDRDKFCQIPGMKRADGGREKMDIRLPDLDAVVGNPPYVRQEGIARRKQASRPEGPTDAKNNKEFFHELCTSLWPGLKLSGRSDLHCYFWPVSAHMLKEGGYFGFLTSSSWLDVEYGFPMQAWMLLNFKIIAIIESMDEPWFQDARVKTCITILQRCSSQADRDKNNVRFVRLLKPLAEILGSRPQNDETAKQKAAEKLRDLILKSSVNFKSEQIRIVSVGQSLLWQEGVRAAKLIKKSDSGEDDNSEFQENIISEAVEDYGLAAKYREYAAGKWGRFIRAPELYFKLLDKFKGRFVRLGDIAEIRRGITSGCDAFFMPFDVTKEILAKTEGGLPWRDVGLMSPCKLKDVRGGKLAIVKAGDNTLHPIERKFIRPEVHSLMQVDRPVIRKDDIDRVVLWVGEELDKIKGSFAYKYIKWGEQQTFSSKKSKAGSVPERSTCASRPRWYDLTGTKTGTIFWPMAQKYRHIVPTNPDRIHCNHNLFFLSIKMLNQDESRSLEAVLNSTLVALIKHFYGRYAGSEGTLKTEVVDTVLLEIPDPRGVNPEIAAKLTKALQSISEREVTHLVDDSMLDCHSEENMRRILENPPGPPRELRMKDRRDLDDAVLELLGVEDSRERDSMLDELYAETAAYYRYQRTQDIQSMVNRASQQRSSMAPQDLASSIWDSLSKIERENTIYERTVARFKPLVKIEIPDGEAELLGSGDMFNPNDIIYGENENKRQISYENPEQASLAAFLAKNSIRGEILVPRSPESCSGCLGELKELIAKTKDQFEILASSRTGNEQTHCKIVATLMQWAMHGRGPGKSGRS